jgi:hypothetical protein
MDLPTNYAAKSSMNHYNCTTISKGTARNREQKHTVEKIQQIKGKTSGRMELWRTCEVKYVA